MQGNKRKLVLNYAHPHKIKAALMFLIDTGARLGELIAHAFKQAKVMGTAHQM